MSATSPSTAINRVAMPAASLSPSHEPSINAAMVLGLRWSSVMGGTAPMVSGASVSGSISLEARAAAGIDMREADTRCPVMSGKLSLRNRT